VQGRGPLEFCRNGRPREPHPAKKRSFMNKESEQPSKESKKFKLGPLGSLNQVTKGLAKTIRAMADGTLDSQVGARICNGLGIMRACLETQKLEQLEARMDEIADRVARDRTNAARERTSTHEA
jgi:hypothetical protein